MAESKKPDEGSKPNTKATDFRESVVRTRDGQIIYSIKPVQPITPAPPTPKPKEK